MKKKFLKSLTGFVLLTFLVTTFPLPVKADDTTAGVAAKCLAKLGIEGLTDLLGLGAGTALGGGVSAAEAALSVPVNDVGAQILQGQQVGTTVAAGKVITVQTCVESITQMLLRIAFEALKKRVFDMLVDRTIQWIQGEGNPQFVPDWKSFFRDAANVAVGDVILDIGAAPLCEGFSPKLIWGLGLQASPPEERFSKKVTCTLSKVVSNVEDFRKDFSQGGWIGLNHLLLPQNNPYGLSVIVALEVSSRQVEAINVSQNESSGGFLSKKVCNAWFNKRAKVHYFPSRDNDPYYDIKVPPDDSGEWVCTKPQIITPGQTIGALATKAVGSDLDFIINAQDLEAYISAIADAAISRLITETNKGLAGLIHRTAGTTALDVQASDLQTGQRDFGNYRGNLSTGGGGGGAGGGGGGGGATAYYLGRITDGLKNLNDASSSLNIASTTLSQAIASTMTVIVCQASSTPPISTSTATAVLTTLRGYQTTAAQVFASLALTQTNLTDDRNKLNTITNARDLVILSSAIEQHYNNSVSFKSTSQDLLDQINKTISQLPKCPP